MQILATSDIHGSISVYRKIFDLMCGGKYDGAILAGDITPSFDVEIQRAFLSKWLLPELRILRKGCKAPIFVIMGNDDFALNIDILKLAQKEGLLNLLHMAAHKLGNYWVAGYSCVNPTPFVIKDWERDERTIENDLNRLAALSDPSKTIYAMHAPPYETGLDILCNGDHVGSKSVRNFIEQRQPPMTIHGHIHESPMMCGYFGENIGKTLSINCGQRIIGINVDKKDFKIIF